MNKALDNAIKVGKKRIKQELQKSKTVSDRSKQEKAAKKEERNNRINLNNEERTNIIKDLDKIIESVGDTEDILKDNELLSLYGPY